MAITGLEEVRQMPGFTTILKAVLKSQIQHLVDQLARETQEESLVVATCLEDGTISHLGSELGKDFLEDSADMKSSFLGFCLKRKYRQMSSKDQGPNRSSESADSYVSSPMLELDYTSAQTSSPHPVTLCQVSSFGQGVVQLKQQELSHHGQQNSPGKIRISGKHRHEPYKGKGEQKNKTGSRQEQHKGSSSVQSEDLAVDYINASNNSSSLGEEDGNVSIKIEPLDESDKQLQEETAVDSDTRFPAHLSKGASTDPISGDTNSSPTNKVQTGDATKTIPYPSSVGMYSPSQESFNMENQFSEVIVKIETSVDMYDQEEETSSCSLDLAETKYEKMEQSICEIQSGKEKGIKETVTKPEECLFSEKKNSNGCGLASGNLQGATSDQTTGCTVDQTIVFTGDQNTIDNSNKSTACITEQTTADTSDQISKIELVCDEVTLDSICDQPLSEVISDMVGSISDQPLSDLICDKNTADMIQNCTVELDRLDNLWDMTDDIDNDPDYEEGSSAEDSESCAENSDSDEFSDSTERRDELQEFLPRSTYTKKTPVEIIDLRKASSEIMPCSRPFNEDDFDRCVNCPNIYTKKLSKNSNENSKIGRLYDKVHACFYCRNLKTNIQSHLLNKHGKKEDVSEIKQLQNREKMLQTEDCRTEVRKEIKRKQALLRNKGDDKHNNSICLLKQGELLLVRRRQVKFNSRLYGACPECREWMLLKVNYGKHIKVCPAKTIMSVSSAIVQSMIFKDHIKTNPSKELHEVFSSMLKDDIGYIALGDKLIIALGEAYFLNTYADKLKRKNYSSFRMRLAARLLNLIQKEIGDDNASMSDCMVVENVDIFAKCVLLACGKTNDEELKYPSVALKIVEDLKKMVAAKIAYAAKSRDFQAREEGKLFDDFLTNEWKAKVKNQAAELLKQRQLKKKDPLPDPQDIATLTKFLIENLETIKLDSDITVYRRVVLLTEARLLLYNRQRPGELESLDIETYKKRLASVNETDLSLRNQLTTLENKLMESRELIELRGKSNNKVPLLLPDDVKKPLAYLADSHVRDIVGIAKDMPYVFASTGKEPVRAGAALDVVKYEAELKHPERIYATNLRKYTATISQVMDLREHELHWLTKYLGHAQKLKMSHYSQTSGLVEHLDIAKIMLLQEPNNVGRFDGVDVANINFEDLDSGKEDVGTMTELTVVKDDPDMSGDDDNDVQSQPVKLWRKTKRKHVTRVPWTIEELEEIQNYFSDCLSLQKSCPGKKDCLAALAKSKSNSGHIWKRQWETVKKKVSHLMTQAKNAGKV